MINPGLKIPAGTADTTDTTLLQSTLGNKNDAATLVVGAIYSVIAYLKGILNLIMSIKKTGATFTKTYPKAPYAGEMDVYESAVPAAGEMLAVSGFVIDMTGTVAPFTRSKIIRLYFKVDGTNYSQIEQITWIVGDMPVIMLREFDTAVQWKVTMQTSGGTEAANTPFACARVQEG